MDGNAINPSDVGGTGGRRCWVDLLVVVLAGVNRHDNDVFPQRIHYWFFRHLFVVIGSWKFAL